MRRALAAFLLLLLAGGALLLYLAIDRAPRVVRGETLSPTAILQARALLRQHDPRRLRQDERRRVLLPVSLLDEAVNHLASRRAEGRGAFALTKDGGAVDLSLPLPGRQLHLNLRLELVAAEDGLHVARAALGRLPLPAGLVESTLEAIACRTGYCREWQLARGAVRELRPLPAGRGILVTYQWESELLERARDLALPPADLDRLRQAHESLARSLGRLPAGAPAPLPEVLGPLLAVDGEEAPARRRAALLALAAALSERDLAAALPQARSWPRLPPVVLTLGGRQDSAQHFAISAALVVWADEPIAEAIGLSKELEDARRGSGFSFADLAADRAGSRFGELMLKQPARLPGTLTDADLLPALDGLPEYLGEREFRRRYGSTDSPAFRELSDEINRRIAALPLYR